MSTRDMIATVRVNNENVVFDQNTIVVNGGYGTKTKKSFARGEGETELVTAVQTDSKIGMVKFSMSNDATSRNQAIAWAKASTNTVQVIYESGTILSFLDMVLDSPDLGGGSDTDIEIDFQGSPAK